MLIPHLDLLGLQAERSNKNTNKFCRKWESQCKVVDIYVDILLNFPFSVTDIGYTGYILLYAITLFHVTNQKIQEWNLIWRDKTIIRMVTT